MVLLKRTLLTKALVLSFLFSTVAGAIFVNLVTANPAPLFAFPTEPITTLPTIVVHSPVQNQIYNSTVWMNFTIVKPESWFAIDVAHHADHSLLSETFVNITSIYFTVDDGERQNIPVHDIDSLFDTEPILNLNFSTMISLTGGAHRVKLGLEADSYYVVNYVYNFSEALSSVKLYAESNTVKFTIAESSEADADNFTIHELSKSDADNSTTTDSSEADANDFTVAEFSEQDAIDFTIAESSEADADNFIVAGSFPTALIVTASLATVAVVGAGLLVSSKKRKR